MEKVEDENKNKTNNHNMVQCYVNKEVGRKLSLSLSEEVLRFRNSSAIKAEKRGKLIPPTNKYCGDNTNSKRGQKTIEQMRLRLRANTEYPLGGMKTGSSNSIGMYRIFGDIGAGNFSRVKLALHHVLRGKEIGLFFVLYYRNS